MYWGPEYAVNIQLPHKVRTFCVVLITSKGHLRVKTQFKCPKIIKMEVQVCGCVYVLYLFVCFITKIIFQRFVFIIYFSFFLVTIINSLVLIVWNSRPSLCSSTTNVIRFWNWNVSPSNCTNKHIHATRCPTVLTLWWQLTITQEFVSNRNISQFCHIIAAVCAFVHQGAEVRFCRNRVSCYSRTSASSLASVILSSQRPFIETFLTVFYILLLAISPPE